MMSRTESETVATGVRIYRDKLRALLEPQHNGKYVIVNVDTGEFEVDVDHLAASDRAAAKWPGARLYATRVGASTLGRVGGRLHANTS